MCPKTTTQDVHAMSNSPTTSVATGVSSSSRWGRWVSAVPWYTIVFVVVLILAWWLVTATHWAPPYILPSPGDTWQVFLHNPAYVWGGAWTTTWETLIGFALATILGVVVAVVMVYSPTFEKTFYPIILFLPGRAEDRHRAALRHLARVRAGAEGPRRRPRRVLPGGHLRALGPALDRP